MQQVTVNIRLIKGGQLPVFKTKGAVACDCYARLLEDLVIPIGERRLVPLGFAVELPEGWEIQIRPRSGLTSKGIDVALGTGDWDYVGEYKANVINNSTEDFVIHNGDRICQVALREAPVVVFTNVKELKQTERGDKGFGHTGI